MCRETIENGRTAVNFHSKYERLELRR